MQDVDEDVGVEAGGNCGERVTGDELDAIVRAGAGDDVGEVEDRAAEVWLLLEQHREERSRSAADVAHRPPARPIERGGDDEPVHAGTGLHGRVEGCGPIGM